MTERKPQRGFNTRDIPYEFAGQTLGRLAEKIWDCEVSPESRNNLTYFSQHLETGSGVVIINHINFWDGPLVSSWLVRELGGFDGNLKILGGPEAQKHFDIKRNPGHAILLRAANSLGTKYFPVVQLNDLRSYTRDERRKKLERYRDGMREILGQPGGVVFFAPEGTRSETGQLQRGMRGAADLRLYGGETPISFLPVGIVPKGEFDYKWNLGKVELRVGEQFDMDLLISQGIPDRLSAMFPTGSPGGGVDAVDTAMLEIAALLPEQMRGVYADYFRV